MRSGWPAWDWASPLVPALPFLCLPPQNQFNLNLETVKCKVQKDIRQNRKRQLSAPAGTARMGIKVRNYLLNDDAAQATPVEIKDKTMAEKLKLIDQLSEKDKTTIIHMIETMLTKKKMMDLLQEETTLQAA
jgi:hypothetical protein